MNTLVWRLHRGQAYIAGAALIVLTAVLLITGIAMSGTYHDFVAGCAAARDCGDPSQVLGRDGLLTDWGLATMAIPLLFGLFWGAPLLATEFEDGTHGLAWTQGVTRGRWVSRTVAWALLAALVWGGALTALVSWWRGPANALAFPGVRFDPGIFDIQRDEPHADRQLGQRAHRLVPVVSIAGIVGKIQAAPAPDGMVTRIVAVDGPGGSGKSTLAGHLSEALGGAAIVHTDDFASWDNPLDWWPRLIEQVLKPLALNRAARYQRYDWDLRKLAEWHVLSPVAYLVLEGVSASRQAFRPYLSYSIWVETPRAERLRRGLERDGEALRAQWECQIPRWQAEG